VDGTGVYRDLRTSQNIQSLATGSRDVSQGVVGLREQNGRALELALVNRGIADSLIEILLGRGSQYGLVCGAERRKHPRNIRR
jgi:hypothetical protein